MESNNQDHVPSNSNIEGASTPEDVLSYHRRYPDGEYVPVFLSPGFRFCPEDDELIVDYLNKEINKEHAPYIRIPRVNVYMHTPAELAESYQSLGKDEWYFFSPRDRKYLNGHRPNRAAGNGFWKATGADKKIYRNGEFVGSKKCLVFYEGKPPNGKKANWIMNEYVTNQPRRQPLPQGADDMRLDDCVLCRIHKKSEYSPKEEKEDAASKSGETAIPAARKSSENKKQAAPKRVKTEHEGTSQHHSLPVLQPNFQMQQHNVPVPQPTLSMPQQNQHAIQYSNQPPWSDNLGELLDFRPQSNPEEAQSTMLQPNLPTPQQNLQEKQHSLQAESHNLGVQPDFHMESILEEENQSHFGNLGNSHEIFDDLISIDGLRFDDFSQFPPMDYFEPIPPSLDNNDHPQNGHDIKAATSSNVYNPRKQS